MMDIKFATPDTVIQPQGALVLEEPKTEDWVLGANDPKNLGVAILKGGSWANYVPAVSELQTAIDGDTFGCTCFSDNNIDETLNIYQEKEEINISDRDVTVGSGTKRGVGNSMTAAAEFKRTQGFLMEDEMPFPRSMTLDEFYATKRSLAQNDKAKLRAVQYQSNYFWVRDLSSASLEAALEVSPVKIAIEGRYSFDANGRLQSTGSGYTHAVMLFDHMRDDNGNIIRDANGIPVERWIYDSENSQFVRMRGDYKVGAAMTKTFKKKAMKYKVAGNPLVLQLDPVSRTLVPYLSGKVYKVLNGTVDYQGITEVPTVKDLPYPLANWAIQDAAWDSTSFINFK